MPLAEYRRKRHFSKTPEPAGEKSDGRSRKIKALRFVVQKHDATRLHYDFRLELEGALKSWAVPKGPSLDPAVKRLAVEVEDHPLEYVKFEGTIPAGEYGAGEVIVWDEGRWTPEKDPHAGLRQGKLEFHLAGKKLQGSWVLLRMPARGSAKNNWLLIKRHDEHAIGSSDVDITEARPESVKSGRKLGDPPGKKRVAVWTRAGGRSTKAVKKTAKPRTAMRRQRTSKKKAQSARASPKDVEGARRARLPASISPQLASLAVEAPRGSEWLHEIKYDGYRIVCFLDHGEVRLVTRNQQNWTHRYRAIADEAAAIPVATAILDGEVVALLESGVSSFQALQNAGKPGQSPNLAYYAFDLLYLDGYDLRQSPLVDRKRLLQELLSESSARRIQFSDHFDQDGPAFFRQSCKLGLEGIISKRLDRPYVERRSDDWRKIKCVAREELIIGGFTLSTAVPRGIGALLVGYHDRGELVYAGRVGTGFSSETLLTLRARLEKIKQVEPPFAAVPARERGREVCWIAPELVAQVEFTGWTDDGILRHPSFQGLREDKPAAAVTRPASLSPSQTPAEVSKMPKRTKPSGPVETPALPASVTLTHPDRVLFPESGLTKLGLATYYTELAKWMLPHVVDRPLSLVRCPTGREGKCFFQKHAVDSTPAVLRRIEIQENNGAGTYVTIDDVDGLVAIAQMSVLEVHVWGSRRDRVEQPDRIVIDLDPDEKIDWQRVIDGALAVRELLAEYDLESFVKTTGGKGLHVVAPLSPRRYEWDTVKAFSRHVANRLVEEHPGEYLATMSKAARQGKIFIDYLRNDRGSTAIAAYSTRAKPGAPVSAPLAWDELTPSLKANHYTVDSILGRLASLAHDPWEKIDKIKQNIPAKY